MHQGNAYLANEGGHHEKGVCLHRLESEAEVGVPLEDVGWKLHEASAQEANIVQGLAGRRGG